MTTPTHRYTDMDGNTYSQKPEHMTQLSGATLVPKTDSRIVLRGKLDSLAAIALSTEIACREDNAGGAAKNVAEISLQVSAILMSEVTGIPLDPGTLFGLNEAELRSHSHHPKKYYGVDHMIPQASMGKAFVQVNVLRTATREVELAAVAALSRDDGTMERPELVQALNRLSSAAYIIMCRILGGYYK